MAISGLDVSGVPTQLAFTKGATYFGDPPPLASHVLPVGGRAVLYLSTGTSCIDGTLPRVRWSGLRLSFVPTLVTTDVDVVVDIDTTCGLGVSVWGRPDSG